LPDSAKTGFPSFVPAVSVEESYGRYSLKLWSGGFCSFDVNPTNHSHIHETFHELCLVIDGRGEFVHGPERFALSPGTFFFSEKNIVHEISSFKTRNLFLFFFGLIISENNSPLTSNPQDAALHRFSLGHRLVSEKCPDLTAYITLICRPGKTFFDSTLRQTIARTAVIDMLDRLSTQKSATPALNYRGPRDIVTQAIVYIEHNLHRQPTIAEIARACSCSERHLRRLFRQATGKSILEAINERKVTAAAQQLLMRFTVTQVAEAMGITSVPHFSRLFKRYNGMSPKEYQIKNAPKPALLKTRFISPKA
jgi:AraC-like DNA-binding protein